MNPTQMYCAWNKEHELPKVGGVEIRLHRADGKTAYYFDNNGCAMLFLIKEVVRMHAENP